ncbi:uncharacterized protein [Nicotiana tomentosiformis]|uniref:uncharacterized protein n=1 Tax=Nicotiana tomentosiformis TaxID=4098 RepID=UPI00388CA718
MQPVAPVQHETRTVTSEAEQLRLERYKKYHPPTFIGLATNDAQGFLEECHRILRIMGISEMSGYFLTTLELSGAAYQWWHAYELSCSDEATSLTWIQFSDMCLREYIPQSFRDAWCAEFEKLRQGGMILSKYAVRFSELARHAPALVAIFQERVHRFIVGLHPSIRFSMAKELEMDISYQQVVSIARRLEGLPRLEWRGTLEYTPRRVISFLKAQRMVEKGCSAYLAYVRGINIDTPAVELVPLVRDFPYVFPTDLSGMQPDIDIDFGIDLLSGTQPISIPRYCMAPLELKELKEQL